MMQLFAEQKSMKADLALHEKLRASDPTRVSEHDISEKKYALSQIENRIKWKDYSSVKGQCEKYFSDNILAFDKNQIISETKAMISRWQTVSEWPHLAAVFLIDVQSVTQATSAELAKIPAPAMQGATPAVAPSATPAVAPSATPADAPAKPADAPAKPADAPAKPADAPAKPAVAPAKPAVAPSATPAVAPSATPAVAPRKTPWQTGDIELGVDITENAELAWKKMYVIAIKANVRDDSWKKVVDTLDQWVEVTLTGDTKTSKGWIAFYEVEYGNEKIGYMSSKVISADGKERYTPATPIPGGARTPKSPKKNPDGTPKLPEEKEEIDSEKNKIYTEVNAMLTSLGLWGRLKQVWDQWHDTKGNDFTFFIDPTSGNVVYKLNRKVFGPNNSEVSDWEQDILNRVSKILKSNGMHGGQTLNNDITDKTIAVVTAGAIGIAGGLAWKKWAKKWVKEVGEKITAKELEEHILTSKALVQATEDVLKKAEKQAAKKSATQADKDAVTAAKEDLKNAKEALEQAVSKSVNGKKYTKDEITELQSSVRDVDDMVVHARQDLAIAQKNAKKKNATQADKDALVDAEDSLQSATDSATIAREVLEQAQKDVVKNSSVIGSKVSPNSGTKPDNIVEFSKRPMNGNDIRAVQRNMANDVNYKPEFIAQDGSVWQIQWITGKNATDTLIKIAPKWKPTAIHSSNQKDFITGWNLNAKNIPAITPSPASILPPAPTTAAARKSIGEWIKNNPGKSGIGAILISGITYNWQADDSGKVSLAPAQTGTRESAPAQTGTRESAPAQTGTRESAPAQTGTRVDQIPR
jgi:hypothetical protein